MAHASVKQRNVWKLSGRLIGTARSLDRKVTKRDWQLARRWPSCSAFQLAFVEWTWLRESFQMCLLPRGSPDLC